MPRINLNKQDLNNLIDCLNDSILRSSSDIKVRQLDSLKTRMLRALYEKQEEPKDTNSKKHKRFTT
jgi:ElaB/YqjD/DUF883 family membrane-anchored ribosome-binding protein